MKRYTAMALSLCLGLSLALIGVGDAFAARMGGGKSFGSRPSFSEPYRRSPSFSPNQPGTARPTAPAQQPSLSPAQQRNQAMRDGFRQRGGLAGLLGGLALGGLLGALFFGGAFEHINFMDLLILGGIAYLLFRTFAARKRAQESAYTPAGYPGGDTGLAGERYQRQTQDFRSSAGFDTDILSRKGGASSGGAYGGVVLPADFDAKGFLNGAKAAYAMMQQAWDEGDLSALRSLTTDKVFGELQDQFRARGGASNRTELLRVDAEILDVRDTGSDREVAVLFDAEMNEQPEGRIGQVREVWHFVRPRNSRQPTWFLDGIQQVED
jgi:predicted lipid-binding transport protein (Tim44 family)